MSYTISYLKFFPVLLCFFALSQSAYSQTANWDSTFRPPAYENKVEQFRSYPNSRRDIIFLGNSITANTDWTELLGIANLKNRGISGDITYGVLDRLDEVIEGKPGKVFILIGINDISRNIPDELILNNFKRMISRIKRGSPKTKIIVQTLLPTNNTFDKFKNHYNKEAHVLWLNIELKKLAVSESVTIIDLYPHFLDTDKCLDKKYTIDGLHLSVEGYTRWKEILIQGKYLK